MRSATEQLEHVISRYLDREITPPEQDALNALLRRDAGATRLFEELTTLDRRTGQVMREALGRGAYVLRPQPRRWAPLLRAAAMGLAASIAAAFWVTPRSGFRSERDSAGAAGMQWAGSSWFAPPPRVGDSLRAAAPAAEPRDVETRRNWIMVPAQRPGEYLILEVTQTRTRPSRGARDF
jgi:hypothetical protein